MPSRTAHCRFCGSPFAGWGETENAAQADANTNAIMHAHECPANPANQKQKGEK